MRSATELRRLETVSSVMARTGMYARDGREMETVGRMLLEDLCFVDGRDDHFATVSGMLADRYGEFGVHGPFAAVF
ncbi:hypothetical protein ACFFMN_14855 [Planobispora siamensis]|uniref:Uncharacterized protein n=1 Tax=Planobispora siamensis TaxID=936338 RepID=A0A8J3SM61_9ACTN|nr:hypothetical protein [Planobispora siamensis]GIH96787.1 hypothetical protein Psi01_74170 [Planobispora siamensis]